MVEKKNDLSKGYLPVALVVVMIGAVAGGAFWLSALYSNVKANTVEIQEINETLKVLPAMKTSLLLIERELGVDSELAQSGNVRTHGR